MESGELEIVLHFLFPLRTPGRINRADFRLTVKCEGFDYFMHLSAFNMRIKSYYVPYMVLK